MTSSVLPAYVAVTRDESGAKFGLSFDEYRRLARTALSVTQDRETVVMGIYRCDDGCALDIWNENRCLTIQVDSQAGSLSLWLAADIDCGDEPLCLLSVGNSEKEWRRLGRVARKAI